MPPRRPTSSRPDSSKPSGGGSKNDHTELKPSPYYTSRARKSRPGGRPREADEPPMEGEQEEYYTSNHYPAEGEEEGGEGTPVAGDPRQGSKEFREMGDGEEPLEEDDDNPDSTRAGPPISL